MDPIKQHRDKLYRLGELFADTGIIDHSAIAEGLSIAKRTSFPIGRVLVMTGWIDDHDINCGVEVQALLRAGTIDKALAKDLLRFSHLNKVDINEAFRLNGLSRNGDNPTSRLGKLMLAAGVANAEKLAQANREAQRHECTLGGAMIMLRLITPKTLEGALNLQIMMRDRKIDFPQAIQFLKEMHERNVSLREVIGDHSDNGMLLRLSKGQPRIGEFLIAAGLVSPQVVLMACEIGNEEDNNIGRVMLSQGHLSELQLGAALQLQEMILNRVITYRRAVKLIKLVGRLKAPLEQIISESKTLDMVFKLLKAAGLVSEKVTREVACQIIDFEDTVAEAMLARGFIHPVHFRIGLVCLEKMHRSELTEAKAAFVVNYCARHPGHELEMFGRVNWAELKRIDIQSDLLSTL
ncbi:MAG: hypothetical protein KGS72_14835 [Cyanobacteria bacterium REEB67]|nr:hypothetical protein [Cyanobacteria bacterium REEB67]